MNTLEQHNKEVAEKFDIQYTQDGSFFKDGMIITPSMIKSFIQSQNKQLYIKIAEGEIERLDKQAENAMKFVPFQRIHYVSAIDDQIAHWQNILTELKK